MENDHIPELKYLDFFKDEDAVAYFGQLGYLLKDGVHIQEEVNQIPYYRFLKKHKDSLNLYYERFFGISLKKKMSNQTLTFSLILIHQVKEI